MGPLEGIRVMDLTTGVAGPHATKLLADYGADVVKVEPPEGDRSRREGPFKDDRPDPEGSAEFLWLNTNKRSVVADLETAEGRDLVRGLALRSDVLVEDFAPGRLAAMGLSVDGLRETHPGLVACSITPFGQDGPYAGLLASDLVLQAMGGAMYATGHAEREPLRLAGNFAEWHGGLAAALAIMLAVFRAERTGLGEHIDVSLYETQAGGKDRRQLNLLAHAYSGAVARRRETAFAVASGVRPCSDGYINLLGQQRLPELLRMIGREDLAPRPEVARPTELPEALVEEIEASYLAWTMQHEMREALAIAQQHRILGGTVHTIADVLADPSFRGRGFWERIDHRATGPLEYPGRPFLMSDSPRPPARRAPLLGEHTEEVRRELEVRETAVRGAAPAPDGRRSLPLEGVRVIDLAVVWAGPFATQLLAEWGAEVVKMEPVTTVQPQTRRTEGLSRPAWFPNGDPGPDPWNRGVNFNSSACDKRSFAGDLRTPAGREAFLRLVAVSDVIVENNVPETIDKLGIRYEELAAINPGIIFVRMPGFGLTGPYRDYRCWGNHLEAMAGHLLVRCYPDATPDAAGETYACDSIAGLMAALAAVMALRHRERTGRGQMVEVPQVEAFAGMMGREFLDYGMNDRVPEPRANDHLSHAPHGAYPSLGEDRWIAIDVADDEQWRALCEVLEAPDLASDGRFREAASRWEHRRTLDREVARRTGTRSREDLFRRLQARGIAAGPVQDDADAFRCAQLGARGFFEPLTRADIGTFDYPGMLFQWRDTPNRRRRPPVRLGEDNEYVYLELLGYPRDEYEALVASGEVGTAYPESVLRRG
jgi:crotonobetainyl-CoA:carnitine CoA-transferase CaiB-like acyl-CoA transferase